MTIHPSSYLSLPPHFFQKVLPTPVAFPSLIRFNTALAEELGVSVKSEDRAAVFSGNMILPDAQPLAQAYAGHQFGNFVPQLGDGRAILLGEVVDKHGRQRDIQLKGAGRTPFSRQGDGRAALGPVIREYILSEAMAALDIPTTRSLAAVTTGETVMRETPLPGAILTRVAASHIRVGTFEYFASRRDKDGIKLLADYCIGRHYPKALESKNPYIAFLESVMDAQASLVARWMGLGFIHGVMNTDNMTISGETIDYGPCAFMDAYHPAMVYSFIDRYGRYAFDQQPSIAGWNLARLSECLLPLLDLDLSKAVDIANNALENFNMLFNEYWLKGMCAKVGILHPKLSDQALIQALFDVMTAHSLDFTLTFRHLNNPDFSPQLSEWRLTWQARLQEEGRFPEAIKAQMDQVNPIVIPRNHRVEQAIAAAEAGDFSKMNSLIEVLSTPFELKPQYADYALPPKPDEIVANTFCGT
jgi:uncharacterized protein YdiU (UPF0061 family)